MCGGLPASGYFLCRQSNLALRAALHTSPESRAAAGASWSQPQSRKVILAISISASMHVQSLDTGRVGADLLPPHLVSSVLS